ncbi:MAG TPA: primosomal protein N' [Chloroflexia bacterium]|nr:primosomal protein N' [Chloroflexia bacterium]
MRTEIELDSLNTGLPLEEILPFESVDAAVSYAEVAMDSPGLTSSLTYVVPPDLRGSIRPGQLVWAPLKKGRAQGVVLSISQQVPSAALSYKLRSLSDIVDSQPVLMPYQLELARWLSQYYFSGLYEAVSLMLPPGFSRVARPTLSLTDSGRAFLLPPGLGSNELFLLNLLREREEASSNSAGDDKPEPLLSDLRKIYVERQGKTTFEKTVKVLEERGLARRGFFLPRPGVKPQVKPFVRLAPFLLELPPDDPSILKKLQRSQRQREVFELLRNELEPGYLMPADEVCLAADTDLKTLKALAAKGLLEIEDREVRRDPLANRPQREKAEEPPLLTYRQSLVWRALLDGFQTSGPLTYLLHGVTGSGKTELYLRSIAKVLKEGKQAVVLVPEIALTAQMVDRFIARFPGRVAVRHSKLSSGEAFDEWRRARDGGADIVIGARSALFSPLPRLGLIIIDEEHEWSYKQDDSIPGSPLYHTRSVALQMARLTGAKLILGSATPAVESFFRAEQGDYRLLSLPDRVTARRPSGHSHQPETAVAPLPLPPVQVVDLRQELKARNNSIFSRDLQHQLREILAAKRQAILFLNRRGTATIVMCRDCGTVVMCDQCDTPMVYHADLDRLICHRCGRRMPAPQVCPNEECRSERIRHFGVGTKRVEEELQRLFPAARIIRWDQDTIAEGGRDTYQVLYDKMANHEADLLVGTQMIAKGLDLPMVALVGVVTADTGLYLPDFRATERTFQLLTQVIGRAGRRHEPGRAIMQSYTPDHYVIQSASHHDYASFYQQELAFRLEHNYPPFSRLIKFVYSHKDEQRARVEADKLANELQFQFQEAGLDPEEGQYSFIGPAPAFQHKLRGMYRYQFLIRIYGNGIAGLDDSDPAVERVIRGIIGDLRPHLHGWSVDVDPQSVL